MKFPFQNRRWVVALVCVAVISGVVPFVSLGQSSDPATESLATDSPVPQSPSASSTAITVTAWTIGNIPQPDRTLQYRGVIRPRRRSELSFPRRGRIETIHVNAGDQVKRGAVIASLAMADLDAAQKMAIAQRDSAAAALAEAIAGPRPQTIQVAAATLRQTEAEATMATRRFKREIELSNSGSGSDQSLDDARFAANSAVASVESARAALDELRDGTREEQIDASRARLAAAEAAIETIQSDRDDSQLVAPYDCVVESRGMDEGAIAGGISGGGPPVLRIFEVPPYEARFGIPPAAAATLQVGQIVQIKDANQTRLASGQVIRLHPGVDAITRNRNVDVQLGQGNQDDFIVGQTVSLHIASPPRGDGLWVPTSALVRGVRGLWSVYVAVPNEKTNGDRNNDPPATPDQAESVGVIERRSVRVITTKGQMSKIAGSIQPDDLILPAGTQRVAPGATVRIRREKPLVEPEPALARGPSS